MFNNPYNKHGQPSKTPDALSNLPEWFKKTSIYALVAFNTTSSAFAGVANPTSTDAVDGSAQHYDPVAMDPAIVLIRKSKDTSISGAVHQKDIGGGGQQYDPFAMDSAIVSVKKSKDTSVSGSVRQNDLGYYGQHDPLKLDSAILSIRQTKAGKDVSMNKFVTHPSRISSPANDSSQGDDSTRSRTKANVIYRMGRRTREELC
jgi:hypothetical protein